jgi:hypothetical protein
MCEGTLKQRVCQQCQTPFVRKGVGYPCKFCSHECKRAHAVAYNVARRPPEPSAKVCEQCSDTFTPHKNAFKTQRFCSKPCADKWTATASPNRKWHTCGECGKSFQPKGANRTRFCSQDCAWKQYHRGRAERKEARLAKRQQERDVSLMKQCAICHVGFKAKQVSERLCSDDCRAEHYRRKAIVASGYDPDSKPCKACGREVESTGTIRAFRPSLCRACAKQASRLSKRRAKRKRGLKQSFATAKHKSAKVIAGLNVLLKFAGNQCPCCGLLMSKAVHPNSDRALELDHALPLSKGGDDLFPNLRPMCRRCNGLKGAFTAPDIVIGEWLKESANQSTHQASVHTHYSDREGFPKGVLNNV